MGHSNKRNIYVYLVIVVKRLEPATLWSRIQISYHRRMGTWNISLQLWVTPVRVIYVYPVIVAKRLKPATLWSRTQISYHRMNGDLTFLAPVVGHSDIKEESIRIMSLWSKDSIHRPSDHEPKSTIGRQGRGLGWHFTSSYMGHSDKRTLYVSCHCICLTFTAE